MKRKIIKLGTATLVASLPSSWIKKYNLSQGDEVEIEERERGLLFTTGKDISSEKTKIDVSNLDPIINRSIAAAYRNGYNEIELTFDKPAVLDKIQKEVLTELIGFEIVEQGKNFCIIKDVSHPSENEFDRITKRIFLLIESMGDEILKCIKDKETNLKHIEYTDFNINKFVNFCLRILNKKGYDVYSKTPTIYFIILSLEYLADAYKSFSQYVTKNKVVLNGEQVRNFEEIHNLFKQYKKIFYEFDQKGAVDISRKWGSVMEKIKLKNNVDFYLSNMGYIVIRMLGNQLTISF